MKHTISMIGIGKMYCFIQVMYYFKQLTGLGCWIFFGVLICTKMQELRFVLRCKN